MACWCHMFRQTARKEWTGCSKGKERGTRICGILESVGGFVDGAFEDSVGPQCGLF